MVRVAASLLVACSFAPSALAHGPGEQLAADASVGVSTVTLGKTPPALVGADVGIGGWISPRTALGGRAAAFVGDDKAVWFAGLSAQFRPGATSVAVSVGAAALRRDATMETKYGPGLHLRLARDLYRGIELSAELLYTGINVQTSDIGSGTPTLAGSIGAGYRFF